MLTGREAVTAALSKDGSAEIPAVLCYPGVYIRDHWKQLTNAPWWHQHSTDVAQQVAWRGEVQQHTGCDWYELPSFYSQDEQRNLAITEQADGVFITDQRDGSATQLIEPCIAGWHVESPVESIHFEQLVSTTTEIDDVLPQVPDFDPNATGMYGRDALARALLQQVPDLYPLGFVSSPLWRTYYLWGFEGMMEMIATRSDLVRYACDRYLQQELYTISEASWLGAEGVWIEDCLTDMIHPRDYAVFNLPYLRQLTEAIHSKGMQCIHYFCGNPAGKWDLLLDTGADGLALEESKKGFTIDIGEVVERVKGRCTVLGNLDAVAVLEHGSEEALRAEVRRQITYGRRNHNKFIMSTGSPVTPGTSVDRVKMFCDMAHMEGKSR
jgi:uroporphyrinogen-III decarboxylase